MIISRGLIAINNLHFYLWTFIEIKETNRRIRLNLKYILKTKLK